MERHLVGDRGVKTVLPHEKVIIYHSTSDNDVILVVNGEQFHCHRQVLISQSSYFMAMFSHNFLEKDKDIIEIKEVDPVAMDTVLSKIYSDDLKITEENALTLLQTASMLQFTDVEKQCIEFVERTLSADTCLRVLQITDSLSLSSLFRKALCFALWEFSAVKESDDFLELPIDYLESYLSSDLLRASDEVEVFEAGLSWVQKSEPETEGSRLELLPRALSTVRLSSLSVGDLKTFLFYPTISSHPLASSILKYVIHSKENKDKSSSQTTANDGPDICAGQSCEASAEKNVSFDEKIIEISKKILGYPGRTPPQVPCVVGHVADSKSSSCHDINPKSSDPNPRRIKAFRKECSHSELKPYILYLSEELDDTGTKKTSLVPLLPLSNISFGPYEPSGYKVASVGKDLFILGGQNYIGYGSCIMSMWRFKTLGRLGEGNWCQEGMLLSPRRHHSVCTVGNSIYLIGGFGKHRVLLDSMDKYHIPTGEWCTCKPIPEALYSAAACVFDGNIYVIGSNVYCYHTLSDSWTTISELKLPKNIGFSSAMVYEDWIYLTGIYTTHLLRFSPKHAVQQRSLGDGEELWVPERVGYFLNKALNTCIVGSKIYSFGLPVDWQSSESEDSTDNSAEKFLAVEMYDIEKNIFELVWTGGPNERKLGNGLEIKDFMTQHCAGCFSMIKF
ncbi:kelch-like protein 30 [Hetaerina americana]|uniref:kelch-like protein 30 n=1 Tax=Hetaerina americana TaxID=62018 RepID=UPI003A7F20D3